MGEGRKPTKGQQTAARNKTPHRGKAAEERNRIV